MILCNKVICRLRKYVRRFAPTVGIRGEEVFDAEQEALIAVYLAWKKMSDFSIRLAFDIARKRVLDVARKRSLTMRRESSFLLDGPYYCDEDFERQMINQIDATRAVLQLDEKDQELVRLESNGFSDSEKAEKLGVNLSTIWWRKNQLRKVLCRA